MQLATKTRVGGLGGALLLSLAGAANAQPVATVPPTVLGPFTGPGAPLHTANTSPRIKYYGTDLGFAYKHGSNIQFMFGDTLATEDGEPIQASTGDQYDDAMGTVLASADPNTFISKATIPPIKIAQRAGTTEAKAFNPGHPLEFFKTPVGGFSNGTREFGIFYTSKPLGCATSTACGKLTCDTGLGFFGLPYDFPEGFTGGCIDDSLGCINDTLFLQTSGFCRDTTSTIYRAPAPAAVTPTGRIMATGLRHLVGMRSTSDERNYGDTKEWLTNKFLNVAVATVTNFTPSTAASRDYNVPANAAAINGNSRVFLWGRPGFIGVKAKGRRLGVYFAYVDIPKGSTFDTWKVNYYTGGTGTPTFSPNENEAAALDLISGVPGVQVDEPHDIVNQMSVVWSQTLLKWVMFYGGGSTKLPTNELTSCGVVEFFVGATECRDVDMGNGAIRMRSADNPWGPWTPPQDIFVPGNPLAAPAGQYGPGGMLRHPDCVTSTCAPHTASTNFNDEEYGFLYGASIVAPWIRNHPSGGINVTWLASSWDPYRVFMLKTRLR